MAKFGYNANTIKTQKMCISPLEISKENATKEIRGLKDLRKLFQNQKLENELNDFQSILIVLSHYPFWTKRVKFTKNG